MPPPPTGLTAAGGIQVSGSLPGGVAHLQVFEAASSDLAAATKLPAEPTALPWTRTGLANYLRDRKAVSPSDSGGLGDGVANDTAAT
ncbi:hypothetical protein [Crenalkalicoccus roseus]|uniref:hypothetical protein n=1 Tax=Crenalkalicoccus roseus TaxID=1485588 RepID=UPI001EFF84D3|nr:hypothetical protein [Crenalkalicoccus roseus]